MGLTVESLMSVVVALGFVACSSTSAPVKDAGPPSRDAASDAPSRDSEAGKESGPDAGGLILTELSVTSKAIPALTLVPGFSPSIHDYYVRCEAGTNALVVSMTAASGDLCQLTSPTKSPRLSKQTVSVSADENQAIVATVIGGTGTEEYWVRCLPHEFPEIEMTPHPEAGTPTPGYYLVGNDVVGMAELGYAMVLDGNGVPVWYTSHAGFGVINVDDLVPGAVSFIGSSVGVPYEILTLSPPATQYVTEEGKPSDAHELRVLPSGDYLLFDESVQTGVNLTGLAVPTSDGGTLELGPNDDIYACNIVEVDKSGAIVWKWVATEHFDPVKDISYVEPPLIGPGGVPLMQPFHCNSIDVDDLGNLLVSARNMDSVFYVERPSGRVLWKVGGQSYSIDGATYVPVASAFHRQHDARFQPGWTRTCDGAGGTGQISLFDDETAEPGPARAVVYDVHVAAPALSDAGASSDGGAMDCGAPADAGSSVATLAWQYKGTTSIDVQGSFRIAADGSRVVGWGINGGHAFTEVDVGGNDLLDFYFSGGESTYRAIKVPLTTFDIGVLRSTAGSM
jgi:hypothetical protein